MQEREVIWMSRCSAVSAICAMGLLLLASPIANGAENVISLTADIINAYGGRRAVENVRSVYMKGKIQAPAFNDKGTYVYYLKKGRKLRVNIRYTRSTEERILNGYRGYESAGAGFSRVLGDRYLGIVYQYRQVDLPYGLLNDTYRITYEGLTEINGRKARVLGLSSTEGPPMEIYVDAKSFFIIKISGLFSMGASIVTLSAELSDFRKVQGIMLPFKITNFAGDQKIAETVVERYQVNADIEDSIFRPGN
jgi:hypothetical protein